LNHDFNNFFAHRISGIFITNHNYIFLLNLERTYFTLKYLNSVVNDVSHYVICFTERDRQSRWSVAYPAACMC